MNNIKVINGIGYRIQGTTWHQLTDDELKKLSNPGAPPTTPAGNACGASDVSSYACAPAATGPVTGNTDSKVEAFRVEVNGQPASISYESLQLLSGGISATLQSPKFRGEINNVTVSTVGTQSFHRDADASNVWNDALSRQVTGTAVVSQAFVSNLDVTGTTLTDTKVNFCAAVEILAGLSSGTINVDHMTRITDDHGNVNVVVGSDGNKLITVSEKVLSQLSGNLKLTAQLLYKVVQCDSQIQTQLTDVKVSAGALTPVDGKNVEMGDLVATMRTKGLLQYFKEIQLTGSGKIEGKVVVDVTEQLLTILKTAEQNLPMNESMKG